MADKHILLTFISPHHFIKDTNILSITSDENGRYYNTLGPSVKKIYKKYHQLDYVAVITSEKTSEDVNIKIGEKEEHISPLRLFERFCKEEVDSSIQVESIHFGNEYDFNANVSSVLEAVNFINMQKEDKLYIHIDVTAGFRNASMLLTAITQLLKLNPQIIIKEVLYYEIKGSNIVCHDIKDIYDISKLSAGAEAFVKYGSTEVLEDYFKGKDIPNLRPLIVSMSKFANVLRICNANLLDKKIEELKNQIEKFEAKATDFNEYELLFSAFIEKIQEKYSNLFAENDKHKRNLNIIEWCVDNHYIQQAITLATEWIPDCFVEQKILYPVDRKDVSNARKNDKKDWDKINKYFIVSYKRNDCRVTWEKHHKNYAARFKKMLQIPNAYSDYTDETAIDLCVEYSNLADLRNEINHIKSRITEQEVKKIIKKAIEDIRSIISKTNNSAVAEIEH